MIYLKTFSLWLLALSVHKCSGFFHFEYKHWKELDRAGGDANVSMSTLWINQPLDHFNPAETRSWRMRYMQSLDYYRRGGPIVLFIGGETTADARWLSSGLMFSFAREVGAAMFLSEHRFYGESVPNNDLSVQNLAYLSSMQALADIKRLLEVIKSQSQFQNSKVVVFGGSYPGNLAAWLRLAYPNLIDAAVSSSAPVLAKIDFYEYLEVVGDALKKYGTPNCYTKVARIFQRYEELLKTSNGIEQLKREENICQNVDMNAVQNKNTFLFRKIIYYTSIVQGGTPDQIKSLCPQGINSIKENNIIHGMPSIWNKELQCFNYDFNSYVQGYDSNLKSWTYQTCTEFGFFITTSSPNQPFGRHLSSDFFQRICAALFGPQFDLRRIEEGVRQTNSRYGGLTPRVNKVVFVNGDMDPWHRLGVLKDLSNEAPARVVRAASHCWDLQRDDNYDLPEKVAVRRFEKQKLKQWIGM